MYTAETIKNQISLMGIDAFIKWMSETKFSEKDISDLEKLHIISDGYPCLSSIYLLAQVSQI